MTGAEALSRLEARGARVLLLPDEKIDITAPAGAETDLLIDELAAHKPEAVAVLRARPPVHPSHPSEAGLLVLDEDRRRRLEERRQRTTAALAERYCPACGFSFWRVSPRGDASCYGCTLIREGGPFRCARCGLEEWRRDEHGRRVCATCHGGDARVAAPPVQTRPEPTSREFSAPRGAG